MAQRDLITVNEAVKLFGVSRATIFRFIKNHKLKPSHRLGDRNTFVSKAAIKRLTAHEKGGKRS